ncbi:MAG: signal peptidase I [Bacilli bacterium]|nr:signal peptidase I [Bacilli bacterium]
MNKIFKMTFNIVFILMIIFLATYFILRVLGIAEIFKVQTASMEDNIHAGDYILICKKNNYKVGDVVTYKKDNYHVTHRIVKKKAFKVVTKGDANNIEDAEISIKDIIGKVIYCGGILNFLINYKYAIASFFLAIYLFSCYFEKKEEV